MHGRFGNGVANCPEESTSEMSLNLLSNVQFSVAISFFFTVTAQELSPIDHQMLVWPIEDKSPMHEKSEIHQKVTYFFAKSLLHTVNNGIPAQKSLRYQIVRTVLRAR